MEVGDVTSPEFWSGTRCAMEQATCMPPAVYSDERFFGFERERLFGRAWVGVAEAAAITEPGRMLVRRVGSTSILIVRDTGGELRGFVNSCRHRGTELSASDCNIGSLIRCPYHRWSYTLNGKLAAAPMFNEVPRAGFDPNELSLLPVRVEQSGLHVFACLDDATPPLAHWLGDLQEHLDGYGLGRWRVQERFTVDVRANWKLLSENFQEYYHLPWVHPELSRVSRVRDHYRYQGPGMYCGQTTTPVSSDERDDWVVLPPAPDLDESDSVSGRFIAIFPNLVMSILPGHAFVIRFEPTAAGRTREYCTLLLPPDTPDDSGTITAAAKETLKFWIEINAEDIDICERSQRGLTHTAAPPGPLSPRFEAPLHRFHNMVAEMITANSASEIKLPAGDAPGDSERFGDGINPVPPSIEINAQSV